MASLMRLYQIASSTLKKRCGIEPKKVSYIVQNLKRFRIRFNSRNHFRFVLYSKCSPSNIRRNETNDQHSFLVQWLIRLPGKQEVHGSIPCEGRVLFFCSGLWSYHHVAISVIRTRQTITSERIITMVHWPGSNIQYSPEWHYT